MKTKIKGYTKVRYRECDGGRSTNSWRSQIMEKVRVIRVRVRVNGSKGTKCSVRLPCGFLLHTTLNSLKQGDYFMSLSKTKFVAQIKSPSKVTYSNSTYILEYL